MTHQTDMIDTSVGRDYTPDGLRLHTRWTEWTHQRGYLNTSEGNKKKKITEYRQYSDKVYTTKE